jgi:hypothetical protein
MTEGAVIADLDLSLIDKRKRMIDSRGSLVVRNYSAY